LGNATLIGGIVARINIEDSLWAGPKFQDLLIKTGNRHTAKGMVVELFTLAQKHWFPEKKLIPLEDFNSFGLSLLIEVGLAENRSAGVYCKGSEESFNWLFKSQINGRKGGLAKASKAKDCLANTKHSVPSSSSSSSSSKEKKNTYAQEGLKTCIQEYQNTLDHFRIERKAEMSEMQIFNLGKQFGFEDLSIALAGMRREKRTDNFNPADHVSLGRLPKNFEKFLNLGAKRGPKTEEYPMGLSQELAGAGVPANEVPTQRDRAASDAHLDALLKRPASK
jgi:hypothetical protein